MRKRITRTMSAALSAVLIFAALSVSPEAKAFTPSTSVIKVGLYFGSDTLESANLENETGRGYDFGYYDSNRDFVSVGLSTDETGISMLRDRNLWYNSSTRRYISSAVSDLVVGCYHIQLDTVYDTAAAAKNAAATFTSVDSFVKYSNGKYYVCVGNYTSESAASEAGASLNIRQGWSVNSGTNKTITVVATGTNRIIMEFDSTNLGLGVRPKSVGGEKTMTWFKGYSYYGGFRYTRVSGGDLTVVNYVNIEDYVKGVIPYEMSNSWPIEALKAQACCARTYAMANLNSHSSNNFDVCNTVCCQVYRATNSANATTDAAVDQTAGRYVTYNGDLCTTYYSSSVGGATESSENVWVAAVPYLRGKVDPYEADIADIAGHYYWTETYTADELTARLNNRGYPCSTVKSCTVTSLTPSGNVGTVTVVDTNGKSFDIKTNNLIYAFGLSSIHFTINGQSAGGSGGTGSDKVYVNSSADSIDLGSAYAIGDGGSGPLGGQVYALNGSGEKELVGSAGSSTVTPNESNVFVFDGAGWGHSVGMSQWGAYSMAKYHGKTFDEIIKFYFTGVDV